MNPRELYLKAHARSLGVPCEILRVIQIEDVSVKILKGNQHTRDCIGIHLLNPLPYDLELAIDNAFSKMFHRIYVYREIL